MNRHHPGLQHPLLGARVELLLALLTRHAIPARHWPLFGVFLLSAIARLPFRGIDTIRLRLSPKEPLEPPVFIVGHWRSGTTHLHNLLGQSPAFGHISPIASGIPDEVLSLGTWLKPWLERALPLDRQVDRVAVTPNSPQEDEIPLANQQLLSVFHALYFPRQFQRLFDQAVFLTDTPPAQIERRDHCMQTFYRKIARHQGKRRLLIKNLVYTAQVDRLRRIWPDAKFIHVIRNPYTVFVSTKHYYHRLLPTLALQDYRRLDIEQCILSDYPRLLACWDAAVRHLAPNQWIEIRYEDLVQQPMVVLAEIHQRLELPDWASARPRIEHYLQSLRGYRTNRYRLDPSTRQRIEAAWGPFIERWGYTLPADSIDPNPNHLHRDRTQTSS